MFRSLSRLLGRAFTARHRVANRRNKNRLFLEPLEDRRVPAIFTVVNTNDAGAGSLRAAINAANNQAGADTVNFNIPGAGVQEIALATALPIITDQLTINGHSQPGASATPLIEIDGSAVPSPGANGLRLAANGSLVRGLAIENFARSGISIEADNCRVIGNVIGATDGNGLDGIIITAGSSGNQIGGAAAGAGNVLSNNGRAGVTITGSGAASNRVLGNQIGVDAAGNAALGNAIGVWITAGASQNFVGGTLPAARNVISGNDATGVVITGSLTRENRVMGNRIGTNAAGDAAIANGVGGMLIAARASSNLVGGFGVASGNIISGNTGAGIRIEGAGTAFNAVASNVIGLDAGGSAALPNIDGVVIASGAVSNVVGGAGNISRGIIKIRPNTISGNIGDGVRIEGDQTSALVVGNRIGTNLAGTIAIGNTRGVAIEAGNGSSTVGGQTSGFGNLISGNVVGVEITGTDTGFSDVVGNRIGTNLAGNAPLGGSIGIRIAEGSRFNDIVDNVISGLSAAGIVLTGGGSSFNDVSDNILGLDPTGSFAVSSGGSATGIIVENNAEQNNIGKSIGGGGNVISGHGGLGISISAAQTKVLENFIGTDATGNAAVPNGDGGILVQANGAIVSNNVVSGNGGFGVRLSGTSGVQLIGNSIGLGFDAVTNVGNGAHGVLLDDGAANNRININRIAFNAGDGVLIGNDPGLSVVTAGEGNAVLGNVIYSNVGQAIDLGPDDGPTANDPLDADPGPNNLQNKPELALATTAGSSLVTGSLSSQANRRYRIEFFSSDVADQAKVFLGFADVLTNGSGVANFNFASNVPLAPGEFVVATATDLGTNDTSELSASVEVSG